MATSPTTRALQGEYAAHSRWRPDADYTELRRELAASRLADHVRKIVAEAPPLTPAQRDRIAILLRGGASV